MARNNTGSFKHNTNMRNHPKIKAIRTKLGNEGYSIWCMLLETFCQSNTDEIKFRELDRELISADFDISREKLESMVSYMVKLDLLVFEKDTLKYKGLETTQKNSIK